MLVYYKDTNKGRIWSTGKTIKLNDGRWVSNPTKDTLNDEGWLPYEPSEPKLIVGHEAKRKNDGVKELFDLYPDLKDSLRFTNSGIVYHYTTWDVLFNGILSVKNLAKRQLTLRAFSVKYMNDENEGLLFSQAYSTTEDKKLEGKMSVFHSESGTIHLPALENPLFKRRKEMIRMSALQNKQSLFSVSFSKSVDSLPMWNSYGQQGKGLSLGFDANEIFNQGYDLVNCVYDNSTIGKIAEKLYFCPYEIRLGFASNLIAKDSHFEYERECRIALCRFNECYCLTNRDQFLPIDYGIKGGYIVPYVDLLLPLESIKEIWIGPTNHMDLAEDSLRGWLKSVGLGSIKICKSSAPLV